MEGQLDIWQIMLDSGLVVKIVLLILIACSVYSWSIILKKRGEISSVASSNVQVRRGLLGAGNLGEIINLTNDHPQANLSDVIRQGVKEYDALKNKVPNAKEHFSQFGFSSLERAINISIEDNVAKLSQRLTMLASIGSVAPFIGLFGTVWGIINSFTGLSSGGTTLDAVAPGIAEALVATAVGLAAAIPAVWFFNIFQNQLDAISTDMHSAGEELLNHVQRDLY